MNAAGASHSSHQGQALPAGTRLEEFIIESVLGSGGFGITYLARDSRLGRRVVIKENLPAQFCFRDVSSLTVSPRHSHGEDAENFAYSLESFEKEAAMLASLDHPGIVKVLRSFEAYGTAYFVMPFVEGSALDDLLKEGRWFEQAEVQMLLQSLLEALGYLHERGIYHRDIKPGNILITKLGAPVLIDFGAARQRLGEKSLTVIESAGYTPFEQLQTHGKIGPWSDLYALGATFYKVLTGETPAKAADRILDEPLVPLMQRVELSGRYSESLLSGVDRALAPHAANRFQKTEDWCQWLEGGGTCVTVPLASTLPPVRLQRSPAKPPPLPVPKLAPQVLHPLAPRNAERFQKNGDRTQSMDNTRAMVPPAATPPPLFPQRLGVEPPPLPISKTSHRALSKAKKELWISICIVFSVPIAVVWIILAENGKSQRGPEPSVSTQTQQPTVGSAANRGSILDQGKIGETIHVKLPGGIPMYFAYCPHGNFVMGSPPEEPGRDDDESQVHVEISKGFWMAQTEVTQGQWRALMDSNPSQFKGEADLPVELVSWEDAQMFIAKLNKNVPSGWKYALPTEAQWEYACRAGTASRFHYGRDLNSTQANFDEDNGDKIIKNASNLQKTARVASYSPNAWGLYDMHGNVWEWCSDWYENKRSSGADPLGPSAGVGRVIRGGSWLSGASICRASTRLMYSPGLRFCNLGFRPVLVSAR